MGEASGAGFEEIEHTADWAIRVWGESMGELLVAAAEGMLTLIGARPTAKQGSRRTVDLSAEDREGLLVGWLEDLLFRLETQGHIPVAYAIEAQDTWLGGYIVECRSTPIQKAIKAVTYHNLEVKSVPAGLEAQIVFDV